MKINIKSIEINNFRSIKHTKIDFFNNKAGIEQELKMGTFELSGDGKNAIASHYAIMARNSLGKTTILEAIGVFSDIFTGKIGQMILDEMIRESNLEINADMISSAKSAFNPMTLLKNSKELRTEIVESINQKSGEYFHLYNSRLISFYKRFFQKDSHDRDKNIEMTLSLYVDNDTSVVKLIFSKDGNLDIKFDIKETQTKDNKDIYNKIQSEIMEYLKTIIPCSAKYPVSNAFLRINNLRTNMENIEILNRDLINLVEIFGKKKVNKLIKLADNRIENISILKHPNGLKSVQYIILNNGSKISLLDLSTGTRQFIILFARINHVKIFNIKNALILIDEIELSLHAELIDVLKISMQFLFEEYNHQFIFTTHNPLAISNYTTNKQVISLFEEEQGNIVAKKMSSIIKPSQSLIKAYESGTLSPYPDAELARNTMVDIYG